ISSSFMNNEGIALMNVFSNELEISDERELEDNFVNFSIWRTDLNTSITKNNTKIDVQLMTSNGTIAGIDQFSFNVILSELNLTLIEKQSQVLKNEQADFSFSLQNEYNKEQIDPEDIIIYAQYDSGSWKLLEQYKQYEIEKLQTGKYNITFNTENSYFQIGNYSFNMTLENRYFNNITYTDNLTVEPRPHNITVLGANHEDRIYNLGDHAEYYLYLNDSNTGKGLEDMEFNLKTNVSGERETLDPNIYEISDENKGNYTISILTKRLFEDRDLTNITIEFHSQKEGIYSQSNENDTLKIISEPRKTILEKIENSSTSVIIGDELWISLKYYDNETEEHLTNAEFELYNNSKSISPQNYSIIEESNNYTITFNLDNLETGHYCLNISANREGQENITYLEAYLNFNFTYYAANFSVTIEEIPELYSNDTSKTSSVYISYKYANISDVEIDISLGPNPLSFSYRGEGEYVIELDSTNLNISELYTLNISISKDKFNDCVNNSLTVEIEPYPSEINIPPEFQDMSIYQEETLEVLVNLKDKFRDQDILDADVRMKLEGYTSYSSPFSMIVADLGWYEGSLKLGDIDPGEYIIQINMTAENYQSTTNSINITILKREQPVISFLTELKEAYVWEETISFKFKLSVDDKPIENQKLLILIHEKYEDGSIEENIIQATTDKEGYISVNYIVPDVESLDIIVTFNGTSQYKFAEFTEENLEIRSPNEQFFHNFLPFIPFIIGMVISLTGYGLYRRSKKKKLQKEWNRKTGYFLDAINVEYILVIHKNSGMALIKQNYGELEFDGDLISGFLHAITNFKYEIKKGAKRKKRNITTLDYQEYQILLKDGQYTRIGLILGGEPSENLKRELDEFIEKFESTYEEPLKDFRGSLAGFEGYQQMINEVFNLTLNNPHVVNKNPPAIDLSTFQKKIISVARRLEEDDQAFFISRLLRYLMSMMEKTPKEKIIGNIYDLREMGFLQPVQIE
ncbi:MAG: hypothetical protein ACOC44_17005, partial [Promethearchaeia archaeon]